LFKAARASTPGSSGHFRLSGSLTSL
jgi:hypothetical protein